MSSFEDLEVWIGIDVGYIDRETGQRWLKESQEISAMLVGLSRSVKVGRLQTDG